MKFLSWESKLGSFCFVKMMVMPPRKVVTCVFVIVRGENVGSNDRFGAITQARLGLVIRCKSGGICRLTINRE